MKYSMSLFFNVDNKRLDNNQWSLILKQMALMSSLF